MTLPSRLRLLRRLRRWRLQAAALLLVMTAAWLGWTLPVREDPAQLLANQPPAAGLPQAAAETPAWPLAADGHLQPSRWLRERFDRLLLTAEPAVARAALEHQAREALPPEQVDTVLRLWDAYLHLQQRAWQVQVDLQRQETWDAALNERQQARRAQLGDDWAQAFYAEEERRLQTWMAERRASQPP